MSRAANFAKYLGRRLSIVSGLTASIWLAASATASADKIIDNLNADRDLTIFSAAIEHSGLADIFNDGEIYTIFAPSDTALRNEGMDFILGSVLLTKSNRDRLNVLLSYHIVRGVRLAPEIILGHIELTTLLDQSLSVVRAGTAISIAPASANSVVTRRIDSDDGVIFVVDRLIWPNWETWPENVAVAER